jgi:hypothetical protein
VTRCRVAGRPGRGLRLVPGLVIAIEPWFLAGGIDKCGIDPNGWSLQGQVEEAVSVR